MGAPCTQEDVHCGMPFSQDCMPDVFVSLAAAFHSFLFVENGVREGRATGGHLSFSPACIHLQDSCLLNYFMKCLLSPALLDNI